MTAPTRLIVTGMHRSGTSFVASILAAWNISMGDRLLPPDRGNTAGYFEDEDFLDLNRRILLACTPDEPGHRDWGWTESETLDDRPLSLFRSEAASLVAGRDAAGKAWGWKDPRTSMLLDFWNGILGDNTRFLLLYRYPWEVADSMLRTGESIWLNNPEFAPRIWTEYNRRIVDFHRRHRHRTVLVSTNRLMRQPEGFAALMRERFGIDADAASVASLRLGDSFGSRPADDPLPRLWQFTHSRAMHRLGELDDVADLGNERVWEAPSRRAAPLLEARPRLSVVIPCHNDGEYAVDAVASVERNAPSSEVIIVDDGSTQPRTREVVAALREAGHRVIEQENSGLSAARNRGIAAAAGDYVIPLDADNRLLPHFADEAVAILDSRPEAGVVYGHRIEFGGQSRTVEVPEFDLARMLWSNDIDACAVVRKALWVEAGGYDEALSDWEDWDFWLKTADFGWEFIRLPRATFEYRVRPESLQHRFMRRTDYPSLLRRFYDKYRDLVRMRAQEVLIAAHAERRQLFRDIELLRASRNATVREIERQLDAYQQIVAARDEELASVKFVLHARDEELAAIKSVLQARDDELASIRERK